MGQTYFWDPTQPIATRVLALRKDRSNYPLSYLTYDLTKNVCERISATGAVEDEFWYDPFGNLISYHNDLSIRFLFSSEYFDRETGLYSYLFRYYNSRIGNWMTRDTIGEDGGLNLYAFCRNNTVNAWDMRGLTSLENHISQGILVVESALQRGIIRLNSSCEKSVFINNVAAGLIEPDLKLDYSFLIGIQFAKRADMDFDNTVTEIKKEYVPLFLQGIQMYANEIEDNIKASIRSVPKIEYSANWWEDSSIVTPLAERAIRRGIQSAFLNSHYGKEQWQHAMYSASLNASRDERKDAQIKAINKIIEITHQMQRAIFSNNGSDGIPCECGFLLGKMLHYLQDSFTPSHAKRAASGVIEKLYQYNIQSPKLHTKGDEAFIQGPNPSNRMSYKLIKSTFSDPIGEQLFKLENEIYKYKIDFPCDDEFTPRNDRDVK